MVFEKVKTWNGIADKGEFIGGLKKLKNLFDFWLERLSKAGSLPSDSDTLRLRKAILIFLALTYAILASSREGGHNGAHPRALSPLSKRSGYQGR